MSLGGTGGAVVFGAGLLAGRLGDLGGELLEEGLSIAFFSLSKKPILKE